MECSGPKSYPNVVPVIKRSSLKVGIKKSMKSSCPEHSGNFSEVEEGHWEPCGTYVSFLPQLLPHFGPELIRDTSLLFQNYFILTKTSFVMSNEICT